MGRESCLAGRFRRSAWPADRRLAVSVWVIPLASDVWLRAAVAEVSFDRGLHSEEEDKLTFGSPSPAAAVGMSEHDFDAEVELGVRVLTKRKKSSGVMPTLSEREPVRAAPKSSKKEAAGSEKKRTTKRERTKVVEQPAAAQSGPVIGTGQATGQYTVATTSMVRRPLHVPANRQRRRVRRRHR